MVYGVWCMVYGVWCMVYVPRSTLFDFFPPTRGYFSQKKWIQHLPHNFITAEPYTPHPKKTQQQWSARFAAPRKRLWFMTTVTSAGALHCVLVVIRHIEQARADQVVRTAGHNFQCAYWMTMLRKSTFLFQNVKRHSTSKQTVHTPAFYIGD